MPHYLHPRTQYFRLSCIAAALIGTANLGLAQESYDFDVEESGLARTFEVRMDEVEIRRGTEQPQGLLRQTAEGVLANSSVVEEGSSRVILKLGKGLDRRLAAAGTDAVASSFPEAEIAPVLYQKGLPQEVAFRRIGTKEVTVYLDGGKTLEEIRNLAGAHLATATRVSNIGILTFDNAFQALDKVEVLRAAGVVANPMLARYNVKHAAPPLDQFFPQQWHLLNNGQNGAVPRIDVNVLPAWDVTLGNGVTMAVVDDGLETLHPDLSANCPPVNSRLHRDFNDRDDDPRPLVANGDFHGTCVAGLAAAKQNNGTPDINTGALYGVSGVSPNTRLLGLRYLSGPTTDRDTADALGWNPAGADVGVSNNSWGFNDALGIAGYGPLAKAALRNAATFNRSGRGQVTVFSAGNGRASFADANNSTTSNSRFVITVGAVNSRGTFSSYSTWGAPLLVAAPGGGLGSFGAEQRCSTTDVTGQGGLNPRSIAPDGGVDLPNTDFTNQMNGTSSAAPITSGVVSLMLSANPDLGWRDVKEILAGTARKIDLADPEWVIRPDELLEEDRQINAAGFKFNHNYGSGLVDAHAAVARSLTWNNLGAEVMQEQTITESGNVSIPETPAPALTRQFTFDGPNLRVEQIEVEVRIRHQFRSQLQIALVSPSGVRSMLARPRPAGVVPPANDRDYADIVVTDIGQLQAQAGGWVFTTTHNWGENSQGTWTLEVLDGVEITEGSLQFSKVRLYGTPSGPERVAFAAQRYTTTEPEAAATPQTLTIRRLGPPVSTFTVGYATSLATATAGVDFTATSGTVTFAPGETTKDITVDILPDNTPENLEQIQVVLTDITDVDGPGVAFGGNSLATIDIIDDEAQEVTVLALDNRAEETGQGIPRNTATFVFSRSKVTDQATVVFFNVGGTATPGTLEDYAPLPETVTIPAFQREVSVTIVPRDDSDQEGNETVVLTVLPSVDSSYSIGTPSADTATIVDNDRPKVQIVALDNAATESELENPPDIGVLQIRRTNVRSPEALARPLAVFLTFSGTQTLGLNYILRYTGGDGIVRELFDPTATNSIIIPSNEETVNVELIPKDDLLYTATKTATVGLLPNDEYDFSFGFLTRATVTIKENDPPLDSRAPVVTVSSPKKKAKFEAPAPVTITGVATDNENNGLRRLQYSVNGGAPVDLGVNDLPAASFNFTITLNESDVLLGANQVEIIATDIAGNDSKTAVVNFDYVQNRALNVTIVGGGSVSKGFSPTSTRQAGEQVTLTAKPSAGQVFDRWVLNPGGQEFFGRTITFTMPNSDVTLEARFVPTPYTAALTGAYNGLIEADGFGFDTSGDLKIQVGSTGAFSGKITFGGKQYRLKGEFSGSGVFSGSIERKRSTPLSIAMQIDIASAGTHQITGTIGTGATLSNILADRAAYGASAPAPVALVKDYTFYFAPPATVGGPRGSGWATMKIDSKGKVKWKGKLPDGAKVSQSTALSKNGTWPLFVNGYGKRGIILGVVTHADLAGSDATASLNWHKLARSNDRYYPGGFKVEDMPMTGSIYTAPLPGSFVFDGFTNATPNASVVLEEGNLLASINLQATVSNTNTIAIVGNNANNVALKLSTKKGTLSGTFTHPVSFKKVKIDGVVLQKADAIHGLFLGSSLPGATLQTGRVRIVPTTPAQ